MSEDDAEEWVEPNESMPVEDVPAVSTANAEPALRNPSLIGWPPMLPVELALGESKPRDICKEYKIDYDEFETMCRNPAFQKAYTDAQAALQKEGMSFRVKARMQSEELLKTSWDLATSKSTPTNVRADLIKATWRVAGFEPKATDTPAMPPLNIQINL